VRGVKRKLIVFVPVSAPQSMCKALFAAGAGQIGDHERCSLGRADSGQASQR